MPKKDQLNNPNHVQMMFAGVSAGVGLIGGAGLPTLTFLGILGAGYLIFNSVESWQAMPAVPAANNPQPLSPSAKLALSACIIMSCFYFAFLNPISQLILCASLTGILGGLFINQCVWHSQEKLNEALRTACQQSKLDQVKALLKQGADPYHRNALGNTAVHAAIQNHVQAAAILQEIHQHSQKETTTLKSVFVSLSGLLSNPIKQKWSTLWTNLLGVLQQNTLQTRQRFYNASYNLYIAYKPEWLRILNTLTAYLRAEFANPAHTRYKNNAQQTPQDLLAITRLSVQVKRALQNQLKKMGAKDAHAAPPKHAEGAKPNEDAIVPPEAEQHATPQARSRRTTRKRH